MLVIRTNNYKVRKMVFFPGAIYYFMPWIKYDSY